MRYLAALVACAALANCGGTVSTGVDPSQPAPTPQTPTPAPASGTAGTMTTNPDGSVSATIDGQSYSLPASAATINGAKSWFSNGNRAVVLPAGSGTALVGYQNSSQLHALGGTRVAPSASGTVVATGRAAVYLANGNTTNSPISLTVNFDSNKVTGTTSSGIGVDGNIDGANIGGNLTYNGASAPLDGGFYDGNGVAGVAKGGDFVAGFGATYN